MSETLAFLLRQAQTSHVLSRRHAWLTFQEDIRTTGNLFFSDLSELIVQLDEAHIFLGRQFSKCWIHCRLSSRHRLSRSKLTCITGVSCHNFFERTSIPVSLQGSNNSTVVAQMGGYTKRSVASAIIFTAYCKRSYYDFCMVRA